MKVYVVDEFIRNDKKREYYNVTLGVFDTAEAAIKCAKDVIDDNFELYGNKNFEICRNKKEYKPYTTLEYCCCLDKGLECKKVYTDYLMLTVTCHELNKSNS